MENIGTDVGKFALNSEQWGDCCPATYISPSRVGKGSLEWKGWEALSRILGGRTQLVISMCGTGKCSKNSLTARSVDSSFKFSVP